MLTSMSRLSAGAAVRGDSKEVSKTRLAAAEDDGNTRGLTEDDATDTSVTVTGKRVWPPADLARAPNGPTFTQDKINRADAL